MVERTRTAVVIDDDPDVRLMLRVALEATGFSVLEAMTGQGGVELVRECGPDLVTLDLMLPDFGGVEACRRIREVTDAYIIMITASSDEADRLVGLATGADDYVTKPFSPREVQARVVAMFRRPRVAHSQAQQAQQAQAVQSQHARPGTPAPLSPPRRPPEARSGDVDPTLHTAELGVLRHGSLVVDTESRVAWSDNFELPLTKIEFDLLVTMVGNPRRVWRRETLLNIVWGGQWSDYHVVEVHIGNLRRKLGDAVEDGAQLIRTVRGIGYRMRSADHDAELPPEPTDHSSGRAEPLHPDGSAIHSEAHQQL
jgi:two-component system, OmpR family, response regulator